MRNLTLRHLRSIVAIAQSGKVSTAATALGLTGPAVTLQLKQMEEEAGLKLFDREPDGMRLTEAGQAMLRVAVSIQSELLVLEEQFTALRGGRLGMGIERRGAGKHRVAPTDQHRGPVSRRDMVGAVDAARDLGEPETRRVGGVGQDPADAVRQQAGGQHTATAAEQGTPRATTPDQVVERRCRCRSTGWIVRPSTHLKIEWSPCSRLPPAAAMSMPPIAPAVCERSGVTAD